MHFPAVGDDKYGSSDGRRTVATLNERSGGWGERESKRVIWTSGWVVSLPISFDLRFFHLTHSFSFSPSMYC